MSTSMKTTENRKLAQQPAADVPFQYRPYRNGARNAPAMAPQEIPISCAMKVTLLWYWIRAMTTEMAIKTTIRPRMMRSCPFSSIFRWEWSRIRSRVMVELEVRTSEDSVDIDAERTRITTIPIRRSGSPDSMAGMMESYPSAATLTRSENSRPKPPRK